MVNVQAQETTSTFGGPTMSANDMRVKHDNSVYLAISDQGHVRYVTIDGHLSARLEPANLMVIPVEEKYWWEQALQTIVASVLAIEDIRKIFNPETLCVNVVLFGSNHIEKSVWLKESIRLNDDAPKQLSKPENSIDAIPSADYYRRAAGLMRVTYDDVMFRIKQLFDSPSVHTLRQEDDKSYYWTLNFAGNVELEVQTRVKSDLIAKGWDVAWAHVSADGHDLIIGMPKQV